MSLGRCFAGHSLAHKLDMARKYGFQGIEVFYEDLVDLTHSMPGGSTPENQLSAARTIRDLCEAKGLEIICLQPFTHFGGLVDRNEQQEQFDAIHLWMQLAHTLGTDLILLPSSFLAPEKVTNDFNTIVEDCIEVAEMGLHETPVIRFAYEALCWGTRIDLWEQSWELVQRVNRPNFGLCFDTFNLAGRIFADPAMSTGRIANCEQSVVSSIKNIVSTVDVNKVFLLQVADAEKLSSPLDQQHPFYNPEFPTRMSWSRNCRLFYGETSYGAYLPVKAVLIAIVRGLGFQGWLSFEVFNRMLAETDNGVPEEMARRAAISWEKMVRDVSLQVEEPASQGRVSAML